MESHRRFRFAAVIYEEEKQVVLNSRPLYLCIAASLSCTAASPAIIPGVPRPEENPAPPPSAPPIRSGSWVFAYAPGNVGYRISRNATVTNLSDSTNRHEVTSNLSHETIALEKPDTALLISATIDSFATTTQGLIGSTRSVQLPLVQTGILGTTGLILNDTVGSTDCSPAGSVLKTDLNNLLVSFPSPLVSGATWRDSVSVRGCQGELPNTSHILRTFTVAGEMNFQGTPVILVERADSVSAEGEGAQQQHHVSFGARGTGSGRYLIDRASGRVINLTTQHELTFTVMASARTSVFAQVVQQDYRLIP
jgi:hypothetical protein